MPWGFSFDEFGDDIPEEEGGPPSSLVAARNAWPEYLGGRMEEDGYLLQNDEWVGNDPSRDPGEDVSRYRQEYLNNVVLPVNEGRAKPVDDQLAQIEEELAFESGLSTLPER